MRKAAPGKRSLASASTRRSSPAPWLGPLRRLRPHWREAVACAALIVATLIVFGPVCRAKFFILDDPSYVTQNAYVKAGLSLPGVRWAFGTMQARFYIPLTWVSLMADVSLYGRGAFGFHLTNLLLHSLNAGLAFWLALRFTRSIPRALLVAILFSLHPTRVESVAWVTERKDVLAGFFGLLALHAYLTYGRRPSAWGYAATTLAFAASLLSKPMLLTLPAVLLVFDYYPLDRWNLDNNRWRRTIGLLLEKAPWALMSAATLVVIRLTQPVDRTLTGLPVAPVGLLWRNGLVYWLKYAFSPLWLSRLAVLYPLGTHVPIWQVAISLLVIVGLTALLLWRARKAPGVLVGWLFYLILIPPMLGFVQTGLAVRLADRFSYFPMLGIALAIASALPTVAFPRKLVWGGLLVMTIGLGVLTRRQVGLWSDSITLLNHTIAVTSDNWMAMGLLGDLYEEKGELDKSIAMLREGIRLEPNDSDMQFHLGLCLGEQGKNVEAIAAYRRAIQLRPRYVEAYVNLGARLQAIGEFSQAAEQFHKALAIDPHRSAAQNDLGRLAMDRGDLETAEAEFQKVLQFNPRFGPALYNLAVVCRRQSRRVESEQYLRRATQGEPPVFDALMDLGQMELARGNIESATACFRRATEVDPHSSVARKFLDLSLKRGKGLHPDDE